MFKNAQRRVRAPGRPDPWVVVWETRSVVWGSPQKLCYLLHFIAIPHTTALPVALTPCVYCDFARCSVGIGDKAQ